MRLLTFGLSRWYDITLTAASEYTYGNQEYRVLVNRVEVCRVKPSNTDKLSVLDFLVSNPVSGPVMACIE